MTVAVRSDLEGSEVLPPPPDVETPAGAPGERSRHIPEGTGRPGYGLYYGNAVAPVGRIVQDGTWSNMWRLLWPDGRLSDMTNLARARMQPP
jgi:hypothetical protein